MIGAVHGSITIPQGCDYKLTLTVRESDTGNLMNLTGYAAKFKVGNKKMTAKYIDSSDGSNRCTCVTGGTAGTVTITVTPHSSTELPTNNDPQEASILQANNVYSIEIVNSSTGDITKVAQSDCYVQAGI